MSEKHEKRKDLATSLNLETPSPNKRFPLVETSYEFISIFNSAAIKEVEINWSVKVESIFL